MARSTIFWVLMLIVGVGILAGALGFGSALLLTFTPVMLWILLALLGWQVYGAMVKNG